MSLNTIRVGLCHNITHSPTMIRCVCLMGAKNDTPYLFIS